MKKSDSKFSEYDPHKANGPSCPVCGREMEASLLNGRRPIFRCPEHTGSPMPRALGLDRLERLRAQADAATENRAKDALGAIAPDLGVLADLLADSVARNNRN